MDAIRTPRLVFVHDWLTGMRGGEKCLEPLCRRWPTSRLFTLLHARGKISPAIEALEPQTSVLQYLPLVERYYRYLLPLMPLAARWELPPCDVVVSFSHCVAKAARPPADVPHICYCFTPMRYAWHMRNAYLGQGGYGGLKRVLLERMLSRLRDWDRAVSERVTHFVAISRTIQQRIHECYGRDSIVIYPPVDTDFYTPANQPRDDFYLCVSAFAPYKRIDLAIAACNDLGRKLVIIGTGQDESRLRTLAGPTVQFLGWQSDEVIRDHFRRCRALLFPGEEDFGIVPVEAMACGAPVLAFGRGGATETVREGVTGLFHQEQCTESLISLIESFERQRDEFDPQASRRQALRFRATRFEESLCGYIESVLNSQTSVAHAA